MRLILIPRISNTRNLILRPSRFMFASLLLLTLICQPAFAQEIYICPMHPHIKGAAGDSCPICGMDLVPQPNHTPAHDTPTEMENTGSEQTHRITIPPQLIQSLGVRVSEAQHHTFGKRIRAFGRIVPNMRLEYNVEAHSSGRISKLFVNAEGDTVKKGQLLYTYYSPDLITAQSDFFIGARRDNAEQRLRLFGMDDRSIELLKNKKTFIEDVPFHAPANGTVTQLHIRQGSHLESGERVMSIGDFSKIWVMADVPLKDLEFINKGDKASVIIPETGLRLDTSIAFIYPINNTSTRTAQIRIELDNKDGQLRPDTYVDIEFESTPEHRLAVPSDAILYSSAGAFIFTEQQVGVYQAVKLDVGITSDGFTEVLSGLDEGQRVVTSGQFMIDGESKIRGVDVTGKKTGNIKEKAHIPQQNVHQH